ncbi:MAG: invasion associated locus B family protein [Rhodospirillaceae bacterium]
MRNLSLVALLTLCLAVPAWAQAKPKLLGQFDDWEAFSATEDGATICYMGSQPKKSEGKYTKRGRVALLVTHRPKDKERGIVSITTGYTYKKESVAKAVIGDVAFDMFTNGEHAFVEEGRDPELVNAMIRGVDMVVTGTSSRGTKTTDTYSLKGFTAAWKAIGNACKS